MRFKLTRERVAQLLAYEQETGVFRWLQLASPCAKQPGDVAGCLTSAGYRGVTRLKGNRSKPFQAQITVKGKLKHLGTFATEELAGDAYKTAKQRLHEGYIP